MKRLHSNIPSQVKIAISFQRSAFGLERHHPDGKAGETPTLQVFIRFKANQVCTRSRNREIASTTSFVRSKVTMWPAPSIKARSEQGSS